MNTEYSATYNYNHTKHLNYIKSNGGYVADIEYITAFQLSNNAKRCIGFDTHLNLNNDVHVNIIVNTNNHIQEFQLPFKTCNDANRWLENADKASLEYHGLSYSIENMIKMVCINNQIPLVDISDIISKILKQHEIELLSGNAGIDLRTFHNIVNGLDKCIGKYLWDNREMFLDC